MTVSASDALLRLKEGNRLFRESASAGVQGTDSNRSFVDLSEGQAPFAAVLGCSDSRVPVENIFSQGAGDLFVIRVAGNVVGPPQLGSIEYAVTELGVRLVVVLGHTGCGAVTAARAVGSNRIPSTEDGTDNLSSILGPIIKVINGPASSQDGSDPVSVEEAVRLNVAASCDELTLQSEVLAEKASSNQLLIVGSVYDLKTGHVDFAE